MSTTMIADTILHPTGDPYSGVSVTVQFLSADLFDLTGTSTWALIENVPATVMSDVTGTFTFALPWPATSDPSSVQWRISLLGMTLTGSVPDGLAGPISLKTLKDAYGWVRGKG